MLSPTFNGSRTSSVTTTVPPCPALSADPIKRYCVPLPHRDAMSTSSIDSRNLSALRNITLDDESHVDIGVLLTLNPIRKIAVCDPDSIAQATEGSPKNNVLLEEEYQYVVALRKARMAARHQLHAKLVQLREERLRNIQLLQRKRKGAVKDEMCVEGRVVHFGSKATEAAKMAGIQKDKHVINKGQNFKHPARSISHKKQSSWLPRDLQPAHGASMSGPTEAANAMGKMETETS